VGQQDCRSIGPNKATSYSADGECSAASGLADPKWQSDSEASGGDAGKVSEQGKEAVRVLGTDPLSFQLRRNIHRTGYLINIPEEHEKYITTATLSPAWASGILEAFTKCCCVGSDSQTSYLFRGLNKGCRICINAALH
jgi:hypothetical protein